MIIKSPCTQCGGPLEFEAEISGQSVECPHCGQQTLLPTTKYPATLPPRPIISKQFISLKTATWIAFICYALMGVFKLLGIMLWARRLFVLDYVHYFLEPIATLFLALFLFRIAQRQK
jgi:hypothetical protein